MAPTPKKVPQPPKPPKPSAPSTFTYGSGNAPVIRTPQPRPTPGVVNPPASTTGTTGTTGGRGTTRNRNRGTGREVPTVERESVEDVTEETPTRDWEKEYYDELRRENRKSAFAIIQDTFASYGLSELAPVVEGFLREGISNEEATIRLRQSEPYKKRFIGNEGRRALGLSAYSEDEYLTAEATYRELLSTNQLDTLASQETYAKLIGGGVSVAEAQDRITNVFRRIDTADDNLKEQIGKYFNRYGVTDPSLQRTDVASAILGGPETAQSLQRTLQKAELRAGASRARFGVDEQRIEQLQKQLESANVSDVYSTAQAGFSTLAQTEPLTQVLAERYRVGTEGLAEELTQEAFFGTASQRRRKLQEQEKATFRGSSGTTQVSLATQQQGSF